MPEAVLIHAHAAAARAIGAQLVHKAATQLVRAVVSTALIRRPGPTSAGSRRRPVALEMSPRPVREGEQPRNEGSPRTSGLAWCAGRAQRRAASARWSSPSGEGGLQLPQATPALACDVDCVGR